MQLSLTSLALLATTAHAFVGPLQQQQQTTTTPPRPTTTSLYSTVEAAAVEPPLAPLTKWGRPYENVLEIQKQAKKQKLPEFAIEIKRSDVIITEDDESEIEYVRNHRDEIIQMMQDHGAVIFRDFEITKTTEGFAEFYGALRMKPCLDPLHSVSARPTVDGSKNSPVYEAVNKESRKNFFIGMHNEFVGTRAPAAAIFGCFKAAETGGEFLVADGRRVFQELPEDLLSELYGKQIRYSVMELPFFNWIENLPGFAQEPVEGIVRSVVGGALNAKVDFDVELQWGKSDYDSAKMLQARAPMQPPVIEHPVTGEPHWFCNVHSHSSVLRKNREDIYGAERFEDGASRINKSDMFFGNDAALSDAQLAQLDEITTKNIKYVKMKQGDAVLLDNYKTMHGRNVFDGTRKHGVAWFEGWEGMEETARGTTTAAAAASMAA